MSDCPPDIGLVPLLAANRPGLFQLGADAARLDLAFAPPLDAQSKTKRGRTFSVFDLAQPALAGGAEAERDRTLFKRQSERSAMCGKIHGAYSPEVNMRSSADIHLPLTDGRPWFSDNLNMAAPEKPLWYLQEWFAAHDKIQRTLVTELGWLPAKANKVWHGIQEPKPSEMHEIAAFLHIKPHELMMAPEEAFRIRRLEAALKEVAREEAPAPAEQKKPGREAA